MTKNERNILFNLAKSISSINTSLGLIIKKLPDNYHDNASVEAVGQSISSLEKSLDLMVEEWSEK